MAFDFPASPTLNQVYSPASGPAYIWNGVVWKVQTALQSAQLMAGMLAMFPTTSAPAGWLKANGAATNLNVYSSLIAIYCGDANNATALHGYRCTDPLNPSTSRALSGGYIVIPDGRGEFFRGLDDGRGADPGRSAWAAQAHAFQNHAHTVTDPGHLHSYVGGGNAAGTGTTGAAGQSANSYFMNTQTAYTGLTVNTAGGGAETRPRNLAPLVCIKY